MQISPQKIESQIKAFRDFDQQLVPGGPVKGLMKEIDGKSRDLWYVKPGDVHVIPGLNPRVQDQAYFDGVQALAEDMVANGYYADKPLTGFITNIEGKDVIALADGHRRHAAAQLAIKMGAPIEHVPLVLKDRSQSMEDITKSLLHSNEGVPFTVFEKAVIAKRFKMFGWDDARIAKEMRCTPAFVGQLHTLSSSPQAIQELVKAGTVSATHAIEMIKTHGGKATEVLTESVSKAKAKGKKKATSTDNSEAAKLRRAKSNGFRFYQAVVLLFADKEVMKVIDKEIYAELDSLVFAVENGKPPKDAKPVKEKKAKAPKEAKAKKTPLAKKIGRATKPKAAKVSKPAAWDLIKAKGDQPQAYSERRSVRGGRREH